MLIRAAAGVSFEYYDLVMFATLAPFFSSQFFAPGDPIIAALNTLLVFALGFVMRPLGATIAGRLADRLGRKPLMLIALGLAGFGSLAIALSPTYREIGVAAVCILIVARMLQGFGHGMESISGFIYMAEIADPKRRALHSCAYPIGLGFGILQGTAFGAILTSILNPQQMQSWGWRIPFFIGAIYGLFILALRRGLDESEAYKKTKDQAAAEDEGYWRTVWKYRKTVGMLFLIWPAASTATYTLSVSYTDFAVTILKANPRDAYWANLIAQLLYLFSLPLWATLSDRKGRRFNYSIGLGGVALMAFPLQTMLGPTFWRLVVPITIGLVVWAAEASTELAYVNELIPGGVRAQVMSIPSSFAAVIFGGTAPYLRSWATVYASPWLFTGYVVLLCVVALVAVRRFPETLGRDLAH